MSTPGEPARAKLVVGLFMKEKALLGPFARSLSRAFGAVDMVSPWLTFDFTDYYGPEMGGPLFRRLFSFEKTVRQDSLADIKTVTNELEKEYSKDDSRRVNADPGILSLERFVLATGKNFTHRIYLKKGIFADLTLIYTKGAFRFLPWTFPDYRDEKMLSFLGKVREKHIVDWKGRRTGTDK